MNTLFKIDGIYRSPSNISVVFADGRPELNINPDHFDRWLHKTDRLEVISETWMRSDGIEQGGDCSTMTMEEYWDSRYVDQDLHTYITLHTVVDPFAIGEPLEIILSEYKAKRAV